MTQEYDARFKFKLNFPVDAPPRNKPINLRMIVLEASDRQRLTDLTRQNVPTHMQNLVQGFAFADSVIPQFSRSMEFHADTLV